MAKRRNNKKDELEEPIVDLGNVGGQAQDFFEDNQRIILGVGGLVTLLVVGFFAFKIFYQQPRQTEAITQIHKSELIFQQDSFEKGLLDPGNSYPGFIDVADQYSGTKSGNLANLYSGISFLRLGNYDKAIRYLNKYNAKEPLTKAYKFGMLGDAYSELGKDDKAISFYKKAVSASGDEVSAPYYMKKAGMLLEKTGKSKEALAQYQKIRDNYYETTIGREMDKYIARVK